MKKVWCITQNYIEKKVYGPWREWSLNTHTLFQLYYIYHESLWRLRNLQHSSWIKEPNAQTFINVKTRIYENSHQTCNKLYWVISRCLSLTIAWTSHSEVGQYIFTKSFCLVPEKDLRKGYTMPQTRPRNVNYVVS